MIVGKAVELIKQRSPKQLTQPAFAIPELSDSSTANPGRARGNPFGDVFDSSPQFLPSTPSLTYGAPGGQASDASGQDSDSSEKHQLFVD